MTAWRGAGTLPTIILNRPHFQDLRRRLGMQVCQQELDLNEALPCVTPNLGDVPAKCVLRNFRMASFPYVENAQNAQSPTQCLP